LNYEESRLLPVMKEGHSSWTTMLNALMALHVKGITINWQAFYAAGVPHKAILPTYPFQRQRYWIEQHPRRQKQSLLTGQEMNSQPSPKNVHMNHNKILLPNSPEYIAGYLAENLSRLLKMSSPEELNIHTSFLAQ